MALNKQIIEWNKTGNYIRIQRIRNPEIENSANPIIPIKSMVLVEVWKDAGTRQMNSVTGRFLKSFTFDGQITSIADGYNKLKTLPEFEGAIDC